ncbi:hypothetical protein TWF481_009483 [Arthrobotrys musiformis]|uniref:RING-type domain-containing protein n=1 Tax=Arthrobotrys musiformis TaxID=47236 RepID=A0AAV9W4Z6_9PEZI
MASVSKRSRSPVGGSDGEGSKRQKVDSPECPESPERCPICRLPKQGDESGPMDTRPCGHRFHRQCIVEWLGSHGKRCPICREWVRVDPGSVTGYSFFQPRQDDAESEGRRGEEGGEERREEWQRWRKVRRTRRRTMTRRVGRTKKIKGRKRRMYDSSSETTMSTI